MSVDGILAGAFALYTLLTFPCSCATLVLETVPLFASSVLTGACSPVGVAGSSSSESSCISPMVFCLVAVVGDSDFLFLDISTDICYSFLGSIRKLVSGVAAWGFIIRHLQYSLFVSIRTHKVCFAGEQAASRHSIILFRFYPPAESAPGFPDPPP